MDLVSLVHLELEMKRMEENSDAELLEMKTPLDKAVSTLDKKLPS
jgi:hypothetical protein